MGAQGEAGGAGGETVSPVSPGERHPGRAPPRPALALGRMKHSGGFHGLRRAAGSSGPLTGHVSNRETVRETPTVNQADLLRR